MVETFDAIVIGTGQAGGPLAGQLAKAGKRVAIIERALVGGTCINVGCTPTKTLLASARVAHVARRVDEYGVHAGAVTVNIQHVLERKDKMVASFRGGSEDKLTKIEGVELIRGDARFTGDKHLEVALHDGGTRSLTAALVFINTGARPAMPPIPGLHDVDALDSSSIQFLPVIPEHLVILGGGAISHEFAQMYARFGSRVSLIARSPRLLEHDDVDVSECFEEIMRDNCVALHLGASVKMLERNGDGVRVHLGHGDALEGSHLLVALGRTPNTDTLGLEAAGIESDGHGFVVVNDHLETNVPGVYALGDVKGGAQYTHVSYDDYRIVRDAILHGKQRSSKHRLVPHVTFTDPQLAGVGMTRTQALEAGRAVRVYTIRAEQAARALESGETAGIIRAVVDAHTDQILGATVLGMEGGELMGVLQMAMIGQVTASTIREGMFAHPTLTEVLNTLFMSEPEEIGA
jgi:pyruvate/2-oxoglutarate dehydrogenase complex dihydrolipoamide dehydrogenase (E3) component